MTSRSSNQTKIPTRVLGVDPGSRNLGYAVLDKVGSQLHVVTYGVIRVKGEMSERLLAISQGLDEVISKTKPQALAIEKVFFAKNAVSALKLGQARGVALLSAARAGLTISEYNPTEIKSTVAGFGRADKDQVAKMLRLLLGKDLTFETADASDALAIALCHVMNIGHQVGASGYSEIAKKNPRKRRLSLAQAVGLKK